MPRKLRTIYSTRSLFCLLVLGAVVLLAACGNNTSTGSTAAPTATTNTSAGTTSTTTKGYGYGNGGSTTSTTTAAISGPTMTVTITTDSSGNFAFSPAKLTIPVGTTVIWKNMTAAPHTVTSDDGKTFNGMLPTGGTFSFTFTQTGTFAYHCNIHPYMKAMIIVH